jgi:diguanylate cyclase (GGDEF)-like protein
MTDKTPAEIEIRQSLGDSGGFHGKSVEEMRIDDDTKLFTKDAWREDVTRLIALSDRMSFPGSIILMDVDHFKAVNDSLGHLEGDKLMGIITQVARSKLRDVDVGGRFGGDEIAVYLPSATRDVAVEAGERIRKGLNQLIETSEPDSLVKKTKPTLSIGVTQVKPKESFESVMKRVDVALYRAKDNGRDRIEVL